ncbi:hypothetical protein EVAR_37989_1 [Eumeta japonica]|uniref:Uncharacterized protein n=1 Tax=Eumeta variegata TaxID=151549 RepID=A0A4C1ZW15_EUMVA|nr:hypothetical protein EVAR_37989_1 [Eumeta japonica]
MDQQFCRVENRRNESLAEDFPDYFSLRNERLVPTRYQIQKNDERLQGAPLRTNRNQQPATNQLFTVEKVETLHLKHPPPTTDCHR